MVKFIENRVLRMSQDDWGSGQPTFMNKKKNSNGKMEDGQWESKRNLRTNLFSNINFAAVVSI